jgi:hypothetical protein
MKLNGVRMLEFTWLPILPFLPYRRNKRIASCGAPETVVLDLT